MCKHLYNKRDKLVFDCRNIRESNITCSNICLFISTKVNIEVIY